MQMIFSAVGDFCMQSAYELFFRRVALQPVEVLDYDRTAAPLLCPRCWTPSSLLVPNRCQRHRHRWQVGVASWRPLRSHSNTTVLVRLQKYFRSPTRSLPSHRYPTMTMDDLQKNWPFRYRRVQYSSERLERFGSEGSGPLYRRLFCVRGDIESGHESLFSFQHF